MAISETEKLKLEIAPKIRTGDYITLGEILKVPQNTARMRFKRDDKEAIEVMSQIIESRENLIQSYENKE